MPPWPTASSIASCTTPIASSCAENRCVNPAPINPSPRLRPPHDPSTPLMQRKGLKRRPFLCTPSRLDDSDHFLHNHFASVAALRSLIGFPRNADRLSSGTLIDFTRIRTSGPEKAQISVEEADDLYREIRVETPWPMRMAKKSGLSPEPKLM